MFVIISHFFFQNKGNPFNDNVENNSITGIDSILLKIRKFGTLFDEGMLCAETVFCTWFDNDAVASYQMELDE